MKLMDLARIIRSKNAGPFTYTIDIMFPTFDHYRRVRDSKVLTPELLSSIYKVPKEKIQLFESDRANAIKISMPRTIPSGNLGDGDIYGAQQQAPLMFLEIPE